jgi:hypothetical protein
MVTTAAAVNANQAPNGIIRECRREDHDQGNKHRPVHDRAGRVDHLFDKALTRVSEYATKHSHAWWRFVGYVWSK